MLGPLGLVVMDEEASGLLLFLTSSLPKFCEVNDCFSYGGMNVYWDEDS